MYHITTISFYHTLLFLYFFLKKNMLCYMVDQSCKEEGREEREGKVQEETRSKQEFTGRGKLNIGGVRGTVG